MGLTRLFFLPTGSHSFAQIAAAQAKEGKVLVGLTA
jgi:hypothetical protein